MTKTATQDLQKRIEQTIDEALELAALGGQTVPATKIARRIYASEPELMAEAQEGWMLERLTWLLLRRRSQRFTEATHYQQLWLPEFPHEPKMIYLANGERERFNSCSIKQVQAHVKLLKTRYAKGPRIQRMEKVVELMRPYSDEEPSIRWLEVKQREIARREKG